MRTFGAASASAASASTIPPVAVIPANVAAAVTVVRIEVRICRAVSSGFIAAISAAIPATCGLAIDVPLLSIYGPFILARRLVLRISTPGAATSTLFRPKFENGARVPSLPVAATLIMLEKLNAAGYCGSLSAFSVEFPAAATTRMSFSSAFWKAFCSAPENSSPPSDRLIQTIGTPDCFSFMR